MNMNFPRYLRKRKKTFNIKMESAISQVLAIPELLYNFLIRLDYDSILNYCRSYKQAQNICNNETFWAQKAWQDFAIPFTEFTAPYNRDLNPAQRYLRYLTQLEEGVGIGSEKYISIDYVAKKAVKEGKDYIVQDLINKGYNNWNLLLEGYAARNDRATVNALSKLADQNRMYQLVAQGALSGNHEDLFRDILKIAPPDYQWNKDELLRSVSKGGTPRLFALVLDTIPGIVGSNTFAIFLTEPIYTNNIELFGYILEHIPPAVGINWDEFLVKASDANNLEMFNFIISQVPAGYNLNWGEFARIAIFRNNIVLFNRIRGLAPPDYNWNWQLLAESALDSKLNKNIKGLFEYIRSQAPPNYNWDWNRLLNRLQFDPELGQYVRSLMPLNQ